MTPGSGRVVLQRRTPTAATFPAFDVRLGASLAAAAVLGVSAGDAFVAVTALLVAAGLRSGMVAAVVVAATVARWGTADLGAVAGDQAVLGAAVLTGELAARASSVLGGTALVLVARLGPSGWPAALPVAFGIGGAVVVAGPAPTSLVDLAVRVVATLLGAVAALAVATVAADRPGLAVRLEAAAAAAAALARLGRDAVTRTGSGWDAVAVVGLLLPFAGVLATLTGEAGRTRVVRAGRWGALGATCVWVALVAASATPGLGRFDPDPTTLAAAAATTLLAAALAVAAGLASPDRPRAALAPVLAGVAVLVLGIVDAPRDLGPGAATVAVLAGCGVAGAAAAASAWRGRPGSAHRLALLLVPAGLLIALRSAPAPSADLSEVAGLAAAALAALLGAGLLRRAVPEPAMAALGCALVAAVALAPVPSVRPWAALVAAGAGLLATGAGGWTALGLAPGLGVVATAAADVPSIGVGVATHLTWAALTAVAATGLVTTALAPPSLPDLPEVPKDDPGRLPVEVVAATAALVGWLAVVPGAWRWAVAEPARLAPWDRAAAVAAAVVVGAVVLHAAVERMPAMARSGGPDGVEPPAAR